MRIPESFIPMKCWWSIGDQNCHSLGYGVEPSSCFYEKIHRVKLKYGSNHLAKVGAKDGLCYIIALATVKHVYDCWYPCYFQFHLDKDVMDQVENLNWFNPMSCVKICNTSTMHHSHTSMLFIGCIAHCILSLKKMNLIIVIKKERTRFTTPLLNLC